MSADATAAKPITCIARAMLSQRVGGKLSTS
jgi:hypothetical protein